MKNKIKISLIFSIILIVNKSYAISCNCETNDMPPLLVKIYDVQLVNGHCNGLYGECDISTTYGATINGIYMVEWLDYIIDPYWPDALDMGYTNHPNGCVWRQITDVNISSQRSPGYSGEDYPDVGCGLRLSVSRYTAEVWEKRVNILADAPTHINYGHPIYFEADFPVSDSPDSPCIPEIVVANILDECRCFYWSYEPPWTGGIEGYAKIKMLSSCWKKPYNFTVFACLALQFEHGTVDFDEIALFCEKWLDE